MVAKAARRILLQSSEADLAALPGLARKVADQFNEIIKGRRPKHFTMASRKLKPDDVFMFYGWALWDFHKGMMILDLL